MNKHKFLLLSIATAALVACGGGGGGGGGGAASAPTGNGNAGGGNNAGPTTYYPTAGIPNNYTNDKKQAYDLLHNWRTSCGFNALEQNAELDTAATGHADYLMARSAVQHGQDPSQPDFTGESALKRAQATGYPVSSTSEIISGGFGGSFFTGSTNLIMTPTTGAPDGETHMRRLFASVYHMQGALAEMTDIGIGFAESADLGSPGSSSFFSVLSMTMANPDSGDVVTPNPGEDLRSFPCDGTTGVLPVFYPEAPNPITGRDLNTQVAGHPIYLQGPDGYRLNVTNATLTDSTGTAVTLIEINSSNDPNSRLSQNQVFFIPDAALDDNTEYTFSYTATNSNGLNESKSFKFVTSTQ